MWNTFILSLSKDLYSDFTADSPAVGKGGTTPILEYRKTSGQNPVFPTVLREVCNLRVKFKMIYGDNIPEFTKV